MSIIKKPFTKYKLDEEKEEGEKEVISLKLNAEERALINSLMILTNYNQSKVIKISLKVCEKVILNNFGSDIFSKLTSSERSKPIFEKDKVTSDFSKK